MSNLVALKYIYELVEPQFVALVGVSIVVPDVCSANILQTLSGNQVRREDCYFMCYVRYHLVNTWMQYRISLWVRFGYHLLSNYMLVCLNDRHVHVHVRACVHERVHYTCTRAHIFIRPWFHADDLQHDVQGYCVQFTTGRRRSVRVCSPFELRLLDPK